MKAIKLLIITSIAYLLMANKIKFLWFIAIYFYLP